MIKPEDYDIETFFPFSLAEEVIAILKEKDCAFVNYADFNLSLIHPKLDRLAYFIEFIEFNVADQNILRKLTLPARFLIRKIIHKEKLFDFLTQENTRKGPVVILQHDADQQPYKTIDLMKIEESLNVVSSSYFFRKQNLDYEKTYNFDIQELQRLEKKGFEIGYHLNAHELGEFDLKKSMEIVEEDIAFFQNHFNLRTFVPHGDNHNIPYSGVLRKYAWCYNGNGFSQNEMWSDGNMYSENLEDPRVVASRLKKGQRGMFLMHPQYYGHQLISARYPKLPVAKEEWWRKLWNLD